MNITFLSGTRADYGKIKPLLQALKKSHNFNVNLLVTGMHLVSKYGNTYLEIEKDDIVKIHKIPHENYLDNNIAYSISHNTVKISEHLKNFKTDILMVHGDRAEALSGAIAALSENILVGHIEGGEVSGTIDEMFRHSISKLSHLHFVSNKKAKERLLLLGELEENIFIIGSPDLDIMSSSLPEFKFTKKRYDLNFNVNDFGILIYHPVTTAIKTLNKDINAICDALLDSKKNYLVIYPNNDPGSDIILETFNKKFLGKDKFKLIPSLRFEHFLTCLKNAAFIIGNSSCGVREAPFYGLPAIDIGNRQHKRAFSKSIVHTECNYDDILNAINNIDLITRVPTNEFGDGKSGMHFLKVMNTLIKRKINIQKSIANVYDV